MSTSFIPLSNMVEYLAQFRFKCEERGKSEITDNVGRDKEGLQHEGEPV